MFYGVINESYDYAAYLEMELDNSLLFFKSLDIVQESGIQVVQEGVWSTIKEKISELWTKFKNWVKGIWEKIKSIFTKSEDAVKKAEETNNAIQKVDENKPVDNAENTKDENNPTDDNAENAKIDNSTQSAETNNDESYDGKKYYLAKLDKITEIKKETSKLHQSIDNNISKLTEEIADELHKNLPEYTKSMDEYVKNFENETFIENQVEYKSVGECKKLSQKITDATKNIGKIIKELEKQCTETNSIISDLDGKIAKVSNEKEINGTIDFNGNKVSPDTYAKCLSVMVEMLKISVGGASKGIVISENKQSANNAALTSLKKFLKA